MARATRKLTHLDPAGRPAMVDVSAKPATAREARAECRVKFPAEVAAGLRASAMKSAKGGIVETAVIAGTATAVLAPVMAPELGLSPKLVGPFIGLVYAGSMFASLMAGRLIARHGPIRLSQWAVLLCAAGLVLLPLATVLPLGALLLVAAPLIIGAGYGPITPASSQVLARTAAPSRMALTLNPASTNVRMVRRRLSVSLLHA